MVNQSADVKLRRVADVVILDIKGDVTSFAEDSIDRAYQEASQMGTGKILLNRDDSYVNSAGIAIIIGIVTDSRRKGETVRLAEPSKHFRKIFDMIGLTKYIDIFDSEEEALAGFVSQERKQTAAATQETDDEP